MFQSLSEPVEFYYNPRGYDDVKAEVKPIAFKSEPRPHYSPEPVKTVQKRGRTPNEDNPEISSGQFFQLF
jgi:hypothetical protein